MLSSVVRLDNEVIWTKENLPRKKRVVRFQYPDANKHDQQQRWNNHCVNQREPLPNHVHKHSNDESCFQQHKDDDQEPANPADKLQVIHHVRGRT